MQTQSIKCVCSLPFHCLLWKCLSVPPTPTSVTVASERLMEGQNQKELEKSGRLLHCGVNVIGKVKMTDVETNWKRSRKAEEERGPAFLEEKAGEWGWDKAGLRDAGTPQLAAWSQGLVVI